MRKLLVLFVALVTLPLAAQIPLLGPTYVASPTNGVGRTGVVFTSDADCTVATSSNCTVTAANDPANLSAPYNETLVATSSVSLTVTRRLQVLAGSKFCVENATTGGQSLTIIGPSGSGVTVSNSATAFVCVRWNGTNYIVAGGTGGGGGSGTVTTFTAPSGSWPGFLVPTVTNASTTPNLAVALASQTANTVLAAPVGSSGIPTFRVLDPTDIPILNQNTTGNAGTASALAATPAQCSGGTPLATGVQANGNANCTAAGATLAVQTAATPNSSQTILNFVSSSTNVTGLALTPSNPSGGVERYEISGTINAANVPTLNQNTTGSAGSVPASGITGSIANSQLALTYCQQSGTNCPSATSPLSGMTPSQVPIAATATTVTSSKALAGTGAAIVTGAASSVSGDVVTYTGTAGQTADSGILASALCQTSGTNCPASLPPSGAAGGDLSGMYPNPTVAKVGLTATINSVPTYEYDQVPHAPLTTLIQLAKNAATTPVHIVVGYDSFTRCSIANCNTGPASGARWPDLLYTQLTALYGSHGTGLVPIMVSTNNSTFIDPQAYTVIGTKDFTTTTIGPVQTIYSANAVMHLATGSTITFASTIPYTNFSAYYATSSASGNLAIVADGTTSLGTANVANATASGLTLGSYTARRFDGTATLPYGTHSVVMTCTGDCYFYAGEGVNGTTGVSIDNVAIGGATIQMFGAAPTTQNSFTALIPGGIKGVITMGQTNDAILGLSTSTFASEYSAYIAYMQGLSSAPAVLIAIPPVDSTGGSTLAPYTAQQITLCQTLNVGCINIQDRGTTIGSTLVGWGTTYNASSGLWDTTHTAPGIHPNTLGSADEYSMIAEALDIGVSGQPSQGIVGGDLTGSLANATVVGVHATSASTAGTILTLANTSGSGSQYNIEIPGSAAAFPNNGLIYHDVTNSDYPFWYSGGSQPGLWAISGAFFGWSNKATDPRTGGTGTNFDTAMFRQSPGYICASTSPFTLACDGGWLGSTMTMTGNVGSSPPINGVNTASGAVAVVGEFVAPNCKSLCVPEFIVGSAPSSTYGTSIFGYIMNGSTPSSSSCGFVALGGSVSQPYGLTFNSAGGFTVGVIGTCPNGTQTGYIGAFSANQFIASGSVPTMVEGAAAGTSPSCRTIVGANLAGTISCTTGTATLMTGTLATVTFDGAPLTTAPHGCSLQPTNAAAATAIGDDFTTDPTTSSWTIGIAGVALTPSTTYTWSYRCI